jgi:hypothetical protein
VPLLGAVGRCAFAIVALYFLTFGALAASAICGISDTSNAAAAGIIIFRIVIGIRIQIFSLGTTPKIQRI